jgi:dipeptidyl aminopeptidase/acylaminoacyl peptidase
LRTSLFLAWSAAAAMALASPCLAAPSIDQSLDMHAVLAPKISPDGARVIYEQSRTNWEDNAFETDLWIADVKSGERHRLTPPLKSSTAAAWSKDGRWIAFLSDRPGQIKGSPDDKKQVYVMPSAGGEAQQLTKFEKGVQGFDWAPDGHRLIVSAAAPDSKANKDRADTFGVYHVFHADYDQVRLWRVDIPAADPAGRTPALSEPTLLTPGDALSVGSFAVSPDGRTIAFDAQRDPDLISGFSSQVYTVSVDGGAVTALTSGVGPNGDPVWSPDGSRVAYHTSNGDKNSFYALSRLAVVGRDGQNAHVIDPTFDEDAVLLKWAPEGIYFQSLQRTQVRLFLAEPATMTVRPVNVGGEPLGGADWVWENPIVSFSSDFRSIAFLGAAPNQYQEIYVSAHGASKALQLTHAGDQLAGTAPAHREVVTWKSADGVDVEGVLITPPNFDPKKTYPLLVVIHGGPAGADMPLLDPDRYYPVERFVAKGALVLKPNYRGSTGYGAKFRALNVKNLGIGDYADVISGVDALIAKGFVDKDRMGAMGWSEGGYISAFITTSSDRFKAVSVGAGISDWTTYYVNTDITPFTRQYLAATPWEDPEVYRKTSPITYVAKAKTPTLIQHGGLDKRVPLPNAFELRQALEDHGVPVKLVIYDGFGHPIDKPKQQRAVMEENEAWFSHYIWGDPLVAALTPRPPKVSAAAGAN